MVVPITIGLAHPPNLCHGHSATINEALRPVTHLFYLDVMYLM
jgi:hypothetical protein